MKMTKPARAVRIAVLMARAVLMACALVALPGVAAAEGYPDRPVRIIVPSGAGGPYDFVGRLLANRLSDLMGQTFFVENRTGRSGCRRLHAAGRRLEQPRVQFRAVSEDRL